MATRIAPYLWLFTVLLFGRVLGQVIVVLFAPKWLPPMAQWQSGLLRYPVLLASQILVLLLMVWICVDFSRATGFWVQPMPRLGRVVLWWSYLYFAAMIIRAMVPRARRWIPIIFHCVVAAFQWTFAVYHLSFS